MNSSGNNEITEYLLPTINTEIIGNNASILQAVSGIWIIELIAIANQYNINYIQDLKNITSAIAHPLININVLSNPCSTYSPQFAFSFASLCVENSNLDCITNITKKIDFQYNTKEALPCEFMPVLLQSNIAYYLMGGQIICKESNKNNIFIEIQYNLELKEIPHWEKIAITQQENILTQALQEFFHINNCQIIHHANAESSRRNLFIFEYEIQWDSNNAEYIPSQSILTFNTNNTGQSYIIHKFQHLIDYLQHSENKLQKQYIYTLSENIQQIQTESISQYNRIKSTLQSKDQQIQELLQLNSELHNVLKDLTEQESHLIAESNTWKASKVASDQLKKEAEEMAQMKSHLSSMISHELRTPLSSLLGFTELMLNNECSQEETIDFMNTIHEESKRMKLLLDEFLDMQRLNSGRVELELANIDLRSIFDYLITSFKGFASGVKIHIQLPAQIPNIKADRSKLEQILRNFVSNAIKYSPEGGDIILSAQIYDNNYIQISIRDQGLGIPEKSLKKLFTEFYRVEESTHINIKGTGLGLSITKQLIEAHTGKVWVHSELNKGSEFFFTMPIF